MNMHSRRPAIRRRTLLAAVASAPLFSPWASALAKPAWITSSQPIRVVVTQGPGAGSDVLARRLASDMQKALDHPVIVDNRPGAAGTLGHTYVAKSPPNGHTLIVSSTGLLLVSPEITSGEHARYTDFTPIAGVIEAPYVLLVPGSPQAPRTFAEWREQLRTHPGTYGSSGVGTMAHLSSALIVLRAGLKAEHVPYKENAQVLQDLVGGRLTFACDTVASARPLLEAGRLRALAVTSAQHLPSVPDLPTLAEAGLPNTVVVTNGGLLASKGTPMEVVQSLSEAVRTAVTNPQFVAWQSELGGNARYLSPADYAKQIEGDAKLWIGLVKQLNLRPQGI
jgi:tripartite-type tricarboxylate transporter receptor subunit TctC